MSGEYNVGVSCPVKGEASASCKLMILHALDQMSGELVRAPENRYFDPSPGTGTCRRNQARPAPGSHWRDSATGRGGTASSRRPSSCGSVTVRVRPYTQAATGRVLSGRPGPGGRAWGRAHSAQLH